VTLWRFATAAIVEKGRVTLSDPAAKYIPELKDLKVGVEKDGKLDIVAAQRQPTIHDLLRHTSGFTYGVFGKSMARPMMYSEPLSE
jgi:CubicO group peptidase (beta-lactamase class C family)